jgi:hypothetical protein
VLAPATLAALPSTRAIPDRDVFYVARPIAPFGGDDVGIRHDWVLVPFHLIEIISRLCCFVHLRIWNGTKERNTDTAA